jgi:hypothetical protein
VTLNPFSVLAAFVAALELGLGAVVLTLVVRSLRRRRAAAASGATGAASDDSPLVASAAMVLVALSALSWPVLYLLLQSLVPYFQDAGVMCMQGVLRVGSESVGPSARLPALVTALEWTKPALVFLAGAWLVLHLADRATRTAPLARRALLCLGLVAGVAVADAGLELTYLATPKEERMAATGCCTTVSPVAEPRQPLPLLSFDDPRAAARAVTAIHFSIAGLLGLGLARWALRRRDAVPAPRGASLLLALAVLSVPTGLAFLKSVAAPAFLNRPEHRCPYCVLAEAPESVVGIGLFVLGAFAVGWALVLAWGARHDETAQHLPRLVRAVVLLALFSTSGAALFAAVGLGIA